MSKDDLLPNEHHVVRCVKHSEQEDGVLSPAGFQLRKDEQGLSVTWIEAVSSATTREGQLRDVRAAMIKGDFKPGGEALFAVLNVGAIHGLPASRLASLAQTFELFVRHDPDGNAGHSQVYGLPAKESAFATNVAIALMELAEANPVRVKTIGAPAA